jgi:acetyl esterase/lipase
MKIEKVLLWENREDVVLVSYVLEENKEIIGSDRRPAVVISPGGGYLGYTEREGEAAALRFTAAGYQTFVLHYSLGKKAKFPCAVYDIGKALCYLHENADRLSLDPKKIVVCGFSAGGNLSASLGVLWDKPFFYEKLQVSPEWLRPAAMVLAYPVVDFALGQGCGESREEQEMSRACIASVTGTDNPGEADYERINLLQYVSENTPPAFLFHLSGDPVVPVENTLSFAGLLAKNHVPFELYVAEDKWHGVSMFEVKDTDAGFFRKDYAGWFDLAKAWLDKKIFSEEGKG